MEETEKYWLNVVRSLGNEKSNGEKPPQLRTDSAILRQRALVIDEFMRITGQESNGIKPTASLEGTRLRREATLIDDPWKCSNQAVRQLSNVSRKGPHQRFFQGSLDPKQDGAINRFGLPSKCKPRRLKRIQLDEMREREQPGDLKGSTVLPDIIYKGQETDMPLSTVQSHRVGEDKNKDRTDGISLSQTEAEFGASNESEAEFGATMEDDPDDSWCSDCQGPCTKTKPFQSVR